MEDETQQNDPRTYTATAEELAAIDEGIRSLDNGEGITFDEALRRARLRHQAWLNADLDLSA